MMKFARFIAFSILLSLTLFSCFRPDDFDDVPRISFQQLTFMPGPGGPNDADSLILTFDFQDGDGDLGLEAYEVIPPYHTFSFVMDSEGEIVTLKGEFEPPFFEIIIGSTSNGLIPLFRDGPAFSETDNRPSSFDCQFYLSDSLINTNSIPPFDNVLPDSLFLTNAPFPPYPLDIVRDFCTDESCAVQDTIELANGLQKFEVRMDTFFIAKNQENKNITVDFFRKKNDTYEFIDWTRVFSEDGCGLDFNARFPEFANRFNDKPLQGTIRYTMASTGFKFVLRNDTFKIAVKIRDLSLNTSNTVESPDLTLEQIGG